MADASDDPSFRIPARPQRRFSSTTVEHDGGVVFALVPDGDHDDDALDALVTRVLDDGPYRYGDWFDLPLPLYLVHDDGTGDTFRVVVRGRAVELHVLPETESAGLRALYDRLVSATDCEWAVECRVDA
ncbi:hypothetical protein ACFQPA_01485 [Halomarina halobia]|uniref:Uncharacterized protein n=1 Tax=Halomarina halobia TaxID=3033386 RepID=A0ABD6A747_9EURY|nr:hypothetical protein [Halomarina sp. PSR21]